MLDWKSCCMPFYNFYWKNSTCSTGSLFLLWAEEKTEILNEDFHPIFSVNKETLFIASREFLEMHSYRGSLLGIGLEGSLVSEFTSTFSGDFMCVDLEYQLFFQLYEGESFLKDRKKSVLVYEILCDLSVAMKEENEILPPLIVAAIEEIHLNYHDVFGVEELSRNLEVSKSHLIRAFQKATGTTPGKYLLKVRLDSAKRALQQNLSLDIVAVMNGFSSAGYFCKVFKKEVGKTPGQWKLENLTYASLETKDIYEEELLLYM